MKKASLIVLLVALLTPGVGSAGILGFLKSGTSEDMQHDFDIVRLKDLATLSGYIEEYKELTGKYPLEGEVAYPHYVHIATRQQEQYARGGPPYLHKKTPVEGFIGELQSQLGAEIEIPFDLQKVPTHKPNFYIYMVVDDVYFLAVHVHHDYSFANKLADHYYKVEVTSNPTASGKGTWPREQLLSNEDYRKAVEVEPKKPGYTDQLRKSLGGNNAF